MPELFDTIRRLVDEDRYLIGVHAREMFDKRGILFWQAVAGLDDGELISERPDDEPFPSIEVREFLPDGTEFMAVWSWIEYLDCAKLVTVHFFDRK
jgi:hypothetical protein